MSQTFSISAKRRSGLTRVCRQWRVSRATLHRHLSAANRPDAPRCRRGPQGAMSDADLAERIRALLADSPFYGEGYRKVWARLRHAGVRTSPRRVLRVMRDHSLLAHQRAGSPRGPRAHDGTITTPGVDEMWGTDMTSVATGEGQAAFGIGLEPVATNPHSSPSTTARRNAWASTPAPPRPAMRRWSQSARPCVGASARSARTLRMASRSATITAAST